MGKGGRINFLFVVLAVFISLAVVGCSGSPEDVGGVAAVTKFVRSGTFGVDMRVADNLPPPQIYDTADMIMLLELRNLGAYGLSGNKCFVQFGGPDTTIVRGVNSRQVCGDLDGKNIYNIEGGFNTVEFKSGSITLPRDTDRFSPPLVVTACYEYQTVASPQVCIDPQFYELTNQQKACQVRDFGLSGGQGAPVAVTAVNVDMVGDKASFEIDVANVGGGKVVSPRTSLTQCPIGLKYDSFDEIRYNVELPGSRMVKCTPKDSLIRLGTGGRGKIYCTFEVGNRQAYETPLRIELNYNYMQSVQKSIEIIRTPS